ncbi:MAG: hypothetical protein IT424_11620 [Pirellulales bacterium]|nr:hypothetical protein [Pirellulales bacterium]
MTQVQWQQLEAVVAAMDDAERQKLARMLHKRPDLQALDPSNPSLGLFADEPELIDEILEGVYEARQNHPLRAVE